MSSSFWNARGLRPPNEPQRLLMEGSWLPGRTPARRRLDERRRSWNCCTPFGVHSSMWRRDLERKLAECGWRFLRSGGRHDVWTDGEREEAVPRHREINERLAQAILKRACGERL